MDSFESNPSQGYSLGRSSCSGYSITHSKSISDSSSFGESITYSPSCTYTGTPFRSYTGNPATIARSNFRYELRDALVVLKNCGALRLAEDSAWCIAELQRLLIEMLTDDMA
jgi:hypothetical protein